MKHPALARVFAVVLCLFAVLLILNAAFDIRSALKSRAEDRRASALLSSRIDEYEGLQEKLSQEGPSQKAQAELDKLQDQYNRDKASHQTALATYTATKGGLKQGKEAMAQADEMMSFSNMLGMAEQGIQSAIAGLADQVYAMQDEALNAYANFDRSLQELDFEAAWAQIESSYYQMEDYAAYLRERSSRVNPSGMLSQVNTLAAGIDALNAGREELDKLELQVIRESIDLTLTKSMLEKQEEEIASMENTVNEIKADERRLVSLRVSLTANEQIKSEYERSDNVISAAKNELTRSSQAYKRLFLLRLAMCLLMILCAVCAFFGIPAAFEKKKSRAMLVTPVVLFILFAAGVNAVNLILEQRLQYLAFGAFLFGLIQLAVILPREELEADEE